jgi:N-acetylglucosaminyldiphosphoundecaprenol N-acetyl-beta-D-mannosaminyltransferase
MGADRPHMSELLYGRIELFGMQIHSVRQEQVLGQIEQWLGKPFERLHYVVTPNVQHTMVYQENAAFREAYSEASLVIADGWPLVWSSRLLRNPLPERVAGSDLLPLLFDRTILGKPFSIFLLGAGPGVGERAAREIHRIWPKVTVVGTYSPPFGFEHDPAENERIVARIAELAPDLLVVGLGAPKQELWTYRFRNELRAKVALCVGASIDFIAGEKERAPEWMQKGGLEWLHRALTEPKRLGRRYAEHAVLFPALVMKELRRGKR